MMIFARSRCRAAFHFLIAMPGRYHFSLIFSPRLPSLFSLDAMPFFAVIRLLQRYADYLPLCC